MLFEKTEGEELMKQSVKPVYLLSDSQLLFWKNDNNLFLNSILTFLKNKNPKAAYIGASNGDNKDFFSIFRAAMNGIGITDCRMIMSSYLDEDQEFLKGSDIILFAGGDVKIGWEVFEKMRIKETIAEKYYNGAVIIGVSAGAIQLCLGELPGDSKSAEDFLFTFKFIPFILGAHDEKKYWMNLQKSVRIMGDSFKGIGIPSGGGLIYYGDQSIEAIRFPLSEFSMKNDEMEHNLLCPLSLEKKTCLKTVY